MDAKILQDLPPGERARVIRDSAEKTEAFTYLKPLSSDELAKKQADLSERSVEMARLNDEKAEFLEGWRARSKPVKAELGLLVRDVRNRAVEVSETAYLMPDHETRTMGYYNENGHLVYQRPMMPGENQLSIIGESKTESAANQ